MHAAIVATLASGALAGMGGWSQDFSGNFPSWGMNWGFNKCDNKGSDAIPPPEVRNLWPQFNQSQWEKYHCFTYADVLNVVPPCADYCEEYTIGQAINDAGFGRDGCHPDDFPCHCARSEVISNLIEPCIFPFINKTATCTLADLSVVQTFVTDSCKFFNATQYADYNNCDISIKKEIVQDIKAGTAPKPSMPAQAFKW